MNMKETEDNKKALLIMPNFFEYPVDICKQLNRLGYDVDFFDDRPSTNSIIKAMIRVCRFFAVPIVKSYFNKIFKKISSTQYDIVVLISGQSLSLSEKMIAKIKKSQIYARFVLYQWDSIKNFPYIVRMHKYFDKCYSFDKDDVKHYPCLQFLPLFFNDKYCDIPYSNSFDYDVCFIGTAHPKKFRLINQMSEQLKPFYERQFIYYYFPSKIVYFFRKIRNKEFKRARIEQFYFKPLAEEKIKILFARTKCILDSSQDGQSGLTMRVFEALGAKKKLITTNRDIENYDFYREENIYIYDGQFDFSSPFFTKSYVALPENIYQKYSLNSWLNVIIRGSE